MNENGIVHVPAFDTNYYVVGRPIEYINIQTNVHLHGVIKSVKFQTMQIVAVDEKGETETISISMEDVIIDKVRFNYRPPIGWNDPFKAVFIR